MDFYESMLYNFSEKLRAAVTPSDEEKQSLLAELMQNRASSPFVQNTRCPFFTRNVCMEISMQLPELPDT